MNKAAIAILLFSASATASAGTNEWQSGWGQGKTEFFAGDEAKSYLNFACGENDELSPVSASAVIAGKEFYSHNDKGGAMQLSPVEYEKRYFLSLESV